MMVIVMKVQENMNNFNQIQSGKNYSEPKVREDAYNSDVKINHQDIISEKVLDEGLKVANMTLRKHNSFIERSIHEKTKAVMYVMRDINTNEVLQEFPAKKMQDMIARMWEMAGLYVDERG